MIVNAIPTFIINLKKRKDRRDSILAEFSGKPEFSVKLVEPITHENAKISLWQTIVSIVKSNFDDQFILICEDDHQFTPHYTSELLWNSLEETQRLNGDILLGGVSRANSTFSVNQNLCWIENFTGLQFVVIFSKFFLSIIQADFSLKDNADIRISTLTSKKFLCYPFISIQNDFGYSDISPVNDKSGDIDNLFSNSSVGIQTLNVLNNHFMAINSLSVEEIDYEQTYIPTYIINLSDRSDRLLHIEHQFTGRSEFDLHIVPAIKHEKGNLGLWLTIRKIVETAMSNDDDLILICEDDHFFTKHYDRITFIKNIVDAHSQGCELMLGGIGAFGSAVKVSEYRYWVSDFYCTQFTLLYKSIFKRILDVPIDQTITADGALSKIAGNKMVIFPFISVQKQIGASDINDANNLPGHLNILFEETSKRLEMIQTALSDLALRK